MSENRLLGHFMRAQLPLIVVLGLSSLLSVLLVLFRVAYSDSIIYAFLVWNLFLAWIPLGCAFLLWWLERTPRRPVFVMAILFAGWFLFFPNAPYIVTDLMHLGYRNNIPIWYDAMLIFSFAWNGIVLGLLSLWIVHGLVAGWVGRWIGWMMVGVTLVASGFGVYLGRFQRWNSWDIVADPQNLFLDMLDRLINPMAHPQTVAVTILFAAFLGIAYLTLAVLVNSNWHDYGQNEEQAETPVFG